MQSMTKRAASTIPTKSRFHAYQRKHGYNDSHGFHEMRPERFRANRCIPWNRGNVAIVPTATAFFFSCKTKGYPPSGKWKIPLPLIIYMYFSTTQEDLQGVRLVARRPFGVSRVALPQAAQPRAAKTVRRDLYGKKASVQTCRRSHEIFAACGPVASICFTRRQGIHPGPLPLYAGTLSFARLWR